MLTNDKYGHTLNASQVFSADDQWIFYDTRNEDTHITRTGSIEKIHLSTGEIVTVYETKNQSLYGPGVGAVACHPSENKIIFIHGLINCDEQKPYGFTRRFGAIVKDGHASFVHAEARTVSIPMVPGALRGGTHAHTWSGDGRWISFTYNDFQLEQLEKSTNGEVKDLRTIGVMAPLGNVAVLPEDGENFSGNFFTTVAATVTERPRPGSDEIERAFDECWIGANGYSKADGSRQTHAIAYQGNVRDAANNLVTEVFVADVPDDITKAVTGKPLEGTLTTRPNVPAGLTQRRITFTADARYPGIQGPRFRLRSSPDGSKIYFLMKDDDGVVQIFSVPVVGGSIKQITNFKQPVQVQFNVGPDGKHLSVIVDNSVWLVNVDTGVATRLTVPTGNEEAPVGGAIWNHKGNMLAYNRYKGNGDNRFLQIFILEMR